LNPEADAELETLLVARFLNRTFYFSRTAARRKAVRPGGADEKIQGSEPNHL
jgi:hypothetical protein